MKKRNLFIAPLFAVATFFATAHVAEAGGCYAAPVVYKVQTVCVNTCKYKKVAYDHCNQPYYYWVTVYTFKDIYSNGTSRVWTRTVTA
ncbi:MAG: hypothetical protein P1V20_20360 [Verrucomicrobiales bacterium]|nr:hypothetical protein [Verrucomicrobiales bacterium]